MVAIVLSVCFTFTHRLMHAYGKGQLKDGSGEGIPWQVISSGGNCFGQAGSVQMGSTAGQTATGKSAAGGITIYHGFWQYPGCCIVPGDANGDGAVNIGDVVYMVSHIFNDGPGPLCKQEGDANYDGSINIGDAVYLLNYIFRPASCLVDPPIGCPPRCGPE